jgi:hypothetical protein
MVLNIKSLPRQSGGLSRHLHITYYMHNAYFLQINVNCGRSHTISGQAAADSTPSQSMVVPKWTEYYYYPLLLPRSWVARTVLTYLYCHDIVLILYVPYSVLRTPYGTGTGTWTLSCHHLESRTPCNHASVASSVAKRYIVDLTSLYDGRLSAAMSKGVGPFVDQIMASR